MSDGLKLLSKLIHGGSTNVLRDLNEELFLDNELLQYQFILNHFRTYGALPQPSTVVENTGIRLPEAAETIEYYLRRVNTRRQYNWVKDHFVEIREALTSKNMEGVSNIFSEGIRALRGGRDGQVIRNIYDANQDMLLAFRERQIAGAGILTPWPTLNSIIGSYRGGNLYSWVARVGVGKTFLSLYQAYTAWQAGFSVLYITFEMPIEELAQRSAAFYAQINPRGLQTGQMSSQAVLRIQTSLEGMENVSRFNLLGESLKPRISAILSYIHEYAPDIVFIDGASFLKSDVSSKNANRLERIQDVMDELKEVTLQLRIPVVINMQFNRMSGKKGKDGSLETIGLTDLVAQHSSVVFKLSPANDLLDEINIEILKDRHGPLGTFNIHYKFSPPSFAEVVEGDWEAVDHEESLFDEE